MATTDSTINSVGRTGLRPGGLNALDWVAMVLMIIGAINWGLVGIANFDLVAAIFGQMSALSRIIYVLIGLAGLWGIVMAIKMGGRDKSITA